MFIFIHLNIKSQWFFLERQTCSMFPFVQQYIMTNTHNQQEDDYFMLIERVNSKGKYQKNIFMLFYTSWFITAFVTFGVSFLLLPTEFQCSHLANQAQCKQFVCSQPEANWKQYLSKPIVGSLAQQLGELHCQYEGRIINWKLALFVGIFFGYIVFSYIADNFGRKIAMIVTWSCASVGIVLICFCNSVEMLCLGLFLTGAGCESNIKVNLAILSQIVDYQLRQTYSLLLQTAYGVAGIFVSIGFYFLYDWQKVYISFCLVPAILTLALIIFYLEETPTYLAKKGSKVILASLRRIATINTLDCNITEEDVCKIMAQKQQHEKHLNQRPKISLLDLFRFKSLQNNTIYLSIILFFLSCLYNGPSSIINNFNINIFLLQIILSISDCVAYPIACYFIFKTQRRKAGFTYFILCAIFNFIGHFFQIPSNCDGCFQKTALILIFVISRYCISYYYGIIFLYIVEIYPEQIRSIGFGTVSAIGALGSSFIQYLFGYVQRQNQDPFLYMLVFSLICFFATRKLPETHGIPLQIQIQQMKKKRMKQKYEPSLEQSYDEIEFGQQSARTASNVKQFQIDQSPKKTIEQTQNE